jgi:TRAP-type C4-dicarboxylate transport system substrate-binding protein
MNSIMMGKYCEELNKKLAGKVEITQYAGGTLLTAPKMAAGVASGIADIGLSHCSYSRGRFPVMEVMELPLGFPSAWIATHVANDFYDKFKPKEWDTYHALMFSNSPPNVVQTLKKPVKTLDELKGMKIRGTGRIGDIVKALGAIPMPIETVDLYETMRRGVIDGNLGPIEQLKGFKIGEVEKYTSATWKIGSVFQFYVVMNKNRWNSLSPDVQKVITDHTREFMGRWATEWNKIDIEGKDYFTKLGGQVIPVSDAEQAKMVKAVEPVVVDYKKDLVSKGFKAAEVDSWVSFIKERIEYWKGQEKTQKIPTLYSY